MVLPLLSEVIAVNLVSSLCCVARAGSHSDPPANAVITLDDGSITISRLIGHPLLIAGKIS
jgi:hypothetical protein